MVDFKKHYKDLNFDKLLKVITNENKYKSEVIDFCYSMIVNKVISENEILNLIQTIEGYKGENKKVTDFCLELLDKENVTLKDKKQYAQIILTKQFYNDFLKNKHWHDQQLKLESYFLSKIELKSCLNHAKHQYENYIKGATGNANLYG